MAWITIKLELLNGKLLDLIIIRKVNEVSHIKMKRQRKLIKNIFGVFF